MWKYEAADSQVTQSDQALNYTLEKFHKQGSLGGECSNAAGTLVKLADSGGGNYNRVTKPPSGI